MIMKRDAKNKTYTVVTIRRVEGKKMFQSTDQSNKSVYKGNVRYWGYYKFSAHTDL